MLETFEGTTPQVDPLAFVHPGAWVIGDVHVGAHASVWPGVVLRGDMGPIRIGPESSIQDGTVAHDTAGLSATVVGRRVTVGHRVVLHGCVVEDECLIGMGAVVLDNARIGTGSLVGAGSVVTAGLVVPPGSLVLGTPARVVRQVGAREREMILGGWTSYLALTRARLRHAGRLPDDPA